MLHCVGLEALSPTLTTTKSAKFLVGVANDHQPSSQCDDVTNPLAPSATGDRCADLETNKIVLAPGKWRMVGSQTGLSAEAYIKIAVPIQGMKSGPEYIVDRTGEFFVQYS